MKTWLKWVTLATLLVTLAGLATVTLAAAQQNVPDAPSATKPQTNPFPADAPKGPPAPKTPTSAPVQPNEPPVNTANPNIKDVPQGGATAAEVSGREQMYTLTTVVNQVFVPVTVRDSDGRMVEGLGPRDFSVYEDGVRQPINFFTSDPFPLSVAVLVDLGMPDMTM